jgi:hypothetical protein
MWSKIRRYPILESPPEPNEEFFKQIGPIRDENDLIDACLLYAVYRFCADFLITEDREIRQRAKRLGVANKVLSVQSALDMFKKIHEKKIPRSVPFIVRKKPYELDLNDSFFSPLKKDYPFEKWWQKISREERDCWVHLENGKIGALLILKEEEEPLPLIEKTLPSAKRLKICTLKVETEGYRIGELFLKIAFEFCAKNRIFEAYITHFTTLGDSLVDLLARFGFEKIGERITEGRSEDVYYKCLLPPEDTLRFAPQEISQKWYPSLVDSERVKKFIVPVTPEFHDLLFPEFPGREQMRINDFYVSKIKIPGNTIDKWYLSHSRVRISPGSLLIFYRSRYQQLTAIGVVHETFQSRDPQKIKTFVKERTVYSDSEIEKMTKEGKVLAIKFRYHFYLTRPISIDFLKKHGILRAPPQSITSISHDGYRLIKREGNIDEYFTFR